MELATQHHRRHRTRLLAALAVLTVAFTAYALATIWRGGESARSTLSREPDASPSSKPAPRSSTGAGSRGPMMSRVGDNGEFTQEYLDFSAAGLERTTATQARQLSTFRLLLPDEKTPPTDRTLAAVRYPTASGAREAFAFFYGDGVELDVERRDSPVSKEVDWLLAQETVLDASRPSTSRKKVWRELTVRGSRATGHDPFDAMTRIRGAYHAPGVLVFQASPEEPLVQYTLYGENMPVSQLIGIAEGLR